jgi:4-amino-4-deoxy-L-arabinose transferase-like glycosyltransferase
MNHARHKATILWAFIILSIALAFRVWVLMSTAGFDYTPSSDDALFDHIGQTLASTGRYALAPESPPTAWLSPLLPSVLAAVYWLAGYKRAVAQSLLLLLSALTAPATLLAGQEVADRRVGVLAGLLVALDPFAWIFAGLFYSEALFTFLTTLAVWMLLRAMRKPQPSRLILLGLTLGLCALARPNGLVVAMGCIVILPLVSDGRAAQRIRQATCVLAVTVLVMAPWIVRNSVVFARFIPTSTDTGQVLLGIYNETCLEYRCLEWILPRVLPEVTEYQLAALHELERNTLQTELALAFLRAHPVEFLGLTPGKLGHFWAQDTYIPNTTYRVSPAQVLADFQRAYYRFLLPVGIVGLLLLYLTGRRQEFIILTSVVAIFSMTTLVLWGNARLRLPLHPLLAIAAAFALTIAYDRTKAWARRTPRSQEEEATPETEARP